MSSIVNKVKDALNPDKSNGSESENQGQRTYNEYDDPSNPRVGGAQQQQQYQQQQGAVGGGRNTRSSAAAAGGRDEYSSAGGAGYTTNDANYSNTGRVGPGAAGNLNAANSSDPTFASSGRSGRTAGAGAGSGAAYGDADPTFASSGRTTGAGAGGYDNVGNAGYSGVRGSDDPTFATTGRTGAGAGAGNSGFGGHRDVGGSDLRQQTANSQRGAQTNEGSHLQQGGLRNTVDDVKESFGGNRGGAGGNNYP